MPLGACEYISMASIYGRSSWRFQPSTTVVWLHSICTDFGIALQQPELSIALSMLTTSVYEYRGTCERMTSGDQATTKPNEKVAAGALHSSPRTVRCHDIAEIDGCAMNTEITMARRCFNMYSMQDEIQPACLCFDSPAASEASRRRHLTAHFPTGPHPYTAPTRQQHLHIALHIP